MTLDDAQRLLRGLDELAVRVRVQEGRLPDDADVAALKHDIQERRDLVIGYLASLRVANADAAATRH